MSPSIPAGLRALDFDDNPPREAPVPAPAPTRPPPPPAPIPAPELPTPAALAAPRGVAVREPGGPAPLVFGPPAWLLEKVAAILRRYER